MKIVNQPSNNVVDRDIQPGGSSSYWIVTDGVTRTVVLSRKGIRGVRRGLTLTGKIYNNCYIKHGMRQFADDNRFSIQAGKNRNKNSLSWNEPADGDVTICAGYC